MEGKSRSTVRDIALILLVRCAAQIAINPIGNFPLNDDWAWGRTVQVLLDTGSFRPTGWGPMSLLSHVVWGAIFCLPAGFSFTALRLASFVASLVAGASCYLLTIEAGGSRALAAVAAMTWLFNPIVFALSATFMTEVPFVAIAVIAALFFARHLRSGKDHPLVIATLCSMAAILSRQIALVLPLSFGAALLALRGFRRDSIARAVLPALACYVVLAIFEQWLIASGRVPALYRPLTVGLLPALFNVNAHSPAATTGVNAWVTTIYVGCMLLPVSLLIAPQMYGGSKTRRLFLVALGLGALAVGIFLSGMGRLLMPLSGNVLATQGIGPPSLRDTYILMLPNLTPLPQRFWEVVTAISVGGAGLLLAGVAMSVTSIGQAASREGFGSTQAIGLFFLSCAACLLAPILAEGFFDRYLIPSLPFVAAAFATLIARQSARPIAMPALTGAMVVLALYAAFSVAATRDYLAWNRARWALLDDALASRLAIPREIDGGFEFNGWHLYSPSYVSAPGKSWWWVDEDKYVVAFGPIQGWEIARERTFSRWLPPGEGRVVLLTRAAK